MQTHIILTILGPDRPGLVQDLSAIFTAHQGNWTESRMVHLGGQFAGLLQVSLPSDQLIALQQALDKLQTNGLQVLFAESKNSLVHEDSDLLHIEVLGLDRPGIIRDITAQLAALKVNIEELFTEQRTAPMSSELLFFASLVLSLPKGVSADQVKKQLEDLSDQLMVDLNFD
ncbi:glycine cleavage system protein R [Thiolinea disciformis]|uniref:glycine cleavage system protein R n=1 Tax=Thiolinea disciformis TaxID=125614 RepID=UPI00036E0EE5|nr:ACT domain-containing protein [Thiolinea disciformis]